MFNNILNMTDNQNQNKFNIKNINNKIKIQSMFFIAFKVMKSLFAQTCVDNVDIQPHASHTFLYILNSPPNL